MIRTDLTDLDLAKLLFDEMQSQCVEDDPMTARCAWDDDQPSKKSADLARRFMLAGAAAIRRELTMFCATHTHVKTGGQYQVLFEAMDCTNHRGALTPMVVYRGTDGKVYARERTEFYDGRFTPVPEEKKRHIHLRGKK